MNSLASFQKRHHGETIIVCGCGESLNDLNHPERFITIGVNDVGRRFDPTYLVVLNPRHQFKRDRFHYVETSRAQAIFTQLDLGISHPNIVRFKLGKRGGADLSDPNTLPYTQNSPYVALCLAAHMGAKHIGLIGVDFTNNHFFGKTGRHVLNGKLASIDQEYRDLVKGLSSAGIKVFNLSRQSKITAFQKITIDQFARMGKPLNKEELASKPLKIVSYATTPVAGVPSILARCIDAQTAHSARCVWATKRYPNGVEFQGDIQWEETPHEAEALLKDADLVIVHNGKTEQRHRGLLAKKPIITMAHNYMWNVDQTFVKQGFPGVVIGQYQATLPEFDGWSVVPNPLPIWEKAYQPGQKVDGITIAYTPSGKHERYARDHKLYWHSKGYDTTMRILDRLANQFSISIEAIRHRQVTHAKALDMKRRAHIVIDECVTGSYHRNSLEGLSLGCVVVNGVGLLPPVLNTLRSCATNGDFRNPFIQADLEGLEQVLSEMIADGTAKLLNQGKSNRRWMEESWDFERQWNKFWNPVVENALDHNLRYINSGTISIPAEIHRKESDSVKQRITTQKDGVSVIIPHGGNERLPLLESVLDHLNLCEHAAEIIVAEIDECPLATKAVREKAHWYVFIENHGIFHKARAMNAGIPFANEKIVLWLDNDILFQPEFLVNAVEEFSKRSLDCLIPWTSVRYLSPENSDAVIKRQVQPYSCKWVRQHFSKRGACGAAVIVRKEFLLKYGGMIEEFRGWGGEDNAWFQKTRILGRAGITQRQDQHLYHLYHEYSGGHGADPQIAGNPFYQKNLSLLKKIRSINNPKRLLDKFPPSHHFTCPWDKKKKVSLIASEEQIENCQHAKQMANLITDLYGIDIEYTAEGINSNLFREADMLQQIDAIVIFGTNLALKLLKHTSFENIYRKTIVVHDTSVSKLSDGSIKTLEKFGEHVVKNDDDFVILQKMGIMPWAVNTSSKPTDNGRSRVLAPLQPLSVLLARFSEGSKSNIDLRHSLNVLKMKIPDMTIAKLDDLNLTEFEAFNYGKDYPVMRRWEMPFAMFKTPLTKIMSVLDCTINPVDFKDRLLSLYPFIHYFYWNPIQEGEFRMPFGLPDQAFDRIFCINTLEHLLKSQRKLLIAELARKLKAGGYLITTCDYYFDWFWSNPELLNMGVTRSDRQEIFNGWNKVTPNELLANCRENNLESTADRVEEPQDSDPSLYRNTDPYSHACIGAVFRKKTINSQPTGKKIVLSLLSWNTKDILMDSLRAYIREAAMLKRLGQEPFIIVCDNGSTDGTREALISIDREIDIPHKFILNDRNCGSSIARNQIIDSLLDINGDYLLFMDGDIEIVSFSSYAMLQHMENSGHLLACIGPDSFGFTPLRSRASKYLFSLKDCRIEETRLVAWTQYGLFRSEIFEKGIRFDENEPFNREGWGFEDNDLAFQISLNGYYNHRFFGITYLHRSHHSSIRTMRAHGIDPNAIFKQRKRYVIQKWRNIPSINNGPLNEIRNINMRL